MKRVLFFLLVLTVVGSSQELVWKRCLSFPGIAGDDYLDVAVDSKDNVIVTALDTGLGSWLIKYNPNGEILWTREVHLPVDRSDPPWTVDVATDPDDNIIVGRESLGIWNVMKLTSNGEPLWTWSYQVAANINDIATNSNGYILVTGDNGGMWFTFQITPEGQTDWMRTFTSNWGPDYAAGVCADPSDNAIVGGYRGVQWRNRQWFPGFVKYSKSGQTLAEAVYIPSYGGNLFAGKLATDRWGNILLPGAGLCTNPGGGYYWYGAFLLKYDPDGNPLWQWFSDTAFDGGIKFHGCVTDTFGNIYAASPYLLPDHRLVIDFRRFPPTGNAILKFIYVIRDNTNNWDMWLRLAIDHHGDIIVATKVGTGNPVNDTGYVLKFTNWPVGIKEPKHPGHCERSEAISSLPTVIHRGKPIALNLPPETNIEVYDKTGRLLNREQGDRLSLSTGVYFLRILSDNHQERRRIIVVK